jgi:hypothetical protein
MGWDGMCWTLRSFFTALRYGGSNCNLENSYDFDALWLFCLRVSLLSFVCVEGACILFLAVLALLIFTFHNTTATSPSSHWTPKYVVSMLIIPTVVRVMQCSTTSHPCISLSLSLLSSSPFTPFPLAMWTFFRPLCLLPHILTPTNPSLSRYIPSCSCTN